MTLYKLPTIISGHAVMVTVTAHIYFVRQFLPSISLALCNVRLVYRKAYIFKPFIALKQNLGLKNVLSLSFAMLSLL